MKTLSANLTLTWFSWNVLLFGSAAFSGGKVEIQSTDLSEACGTVQDDKVTAFRPVMKRWSRWGSALTWKKHTHIHTYTRSRTICKGEKKGLVSAYPFAFYLN